MGESMVVFPISRQAGGMRIEKSAAWGPKVAPNSCERNIFQDVALATYWGHNQSPSRSNQWEGDMWHARHIASATYVALAICHINAWPPPLVPNVKSKVFLLLKLVASATYVALATSFNI